MPGAFADPCRPVDRGVIAPIAENEPVTTLKVAGPEAGAGLPPMIPAGMRAISVRVNEVVGVAGFVLPGTRVDVLVAVGTAASDSNEPMARTVVSNVQVLTAGTRFDQAEAKNGQSQKVGGGDAGGAARRRRAHRAGHDRRELSLVLRNPVDADPTKPRASSWRRS